MKLPQKLSMNRRQIILAGTMTALASGRRRRRTAATRPTTVIELWPGGAPGGERVTVREEIVERLPDGPLRDRFAQHVTRPTADAVPAQGGMQRHHAAHRAGRRLRARGHRQGRRGGGRVVHRARFRGRRVALSPARGWLGGRRRRAGARRHARAAPAAARSRDPGRRVAAHRRHRLFGRRSSVRAADHRARNRRTRGATRPTTCPRGRISRCSCIRSSRPRARMRMRGPRSSC